ncbi:hypothetical protein GGX14DRAFT_404054 [Mycena pura]|uniref:Uncharacterized protein n=1 Tax=Mycena pura TaxID=153505 RepID=A0AAD6UV32_9AGAR|nr:hypothetical protein GGX14DRAFT_404054 [Mycena pura]
MKLGKITGKGVSDQFETLFHGIYEFFFGVTRKVWRMRKSSVRNDQLTSYDSLQAERDTGVKENKESIEQLGEKFFNAEIKSLQAQMVIDKHRSDHCGEKKILPKEIGPRTR